MWGLSIPFWETVFRWATISAFVLGGFTATAAFVSAWVGYELSDIVQKDADRRIAEAKADAARANESSEKLRNDTARLQADNLALQTVLLPRHVGIIGVNERPKAETWFADMAAFAGVPIVIQPTDDNEARNLAVEITIALAFVGVVASIDENASGLKPSQFAEGLSVAYATGKPWTKEAPNQPWFKWAKAANALADALTKAGLAVGDFPVQRYGLIPADDPAAGNFKTIREGVLVYVGPRPVSHTIAWIKQGRPDAAGVKAPDAVPTEPHK